MDQFVFEGKHCMENEQFDSIMDSVMMSLKKRGLDPYIQLLGYLQENNPLFITRYNNARTVIETLDKERVRRYVMEMNR